MRSFIVLVGIVMVALGLVLGIVAVDNSRKRLSNRALATCVSFGDTHTVTIRNDIVTPQRVNGRLCDRITFKNADQLTRKIGFGDHEKHVPYDGVSERVLLAGESFTITLNQIGAYEYHDHYEESVGGKFIVAE